MEQDEGAKMDGGGPNGQQEVFPKELQAKVGHLKTAIDELAHFLEHRNMDCYFQNLLAQLSQLSRDVDCRLDEVSTFFTFLSSHQVPTTSTTSGYFSLLPDELLLKILSFLTEQELSAVASVNQQWKRLSEDESLWKRLYFRRWKDRKLGPRQPHVSHYFTLSALSAPLVPAMSVDGPTTGEEKGGSSSTSGSSAPLPSSLEPAATTVVGKPPLSSSSSPTAEASNGLGAASPMMKGDRNSLSLSSPVPLGSARYRTKPAASLSMSEDYSSESEASSDGMHDDARKKREKRDWKHGYVRRRNIEANWRDGRHKVRTFPGHTSTRVRCLQFDDDKLAMGSFDQKCVRVLDFATRRSLQELVGHTGGVMSLRFDRNILLSASRDRTVKMWDMTTGANAATFTEHVASVWCLDWDGGFNCVSGSEDRLVKLWDLKSGKCIHTYTGHTKGIGSITFDSRYVASGSRDKTIRLWDQRMRRCLHTYKGHTNSVRCLSFDERKLVSGSWDNTIKIWDLVTGEQTKNLKGHTDRVLTLQFDDYKIVSGSFDQTVKIWNIETGVCQHTLGHSFPLAHIQFDESKIISGSRDLTVKVWDFS